MLAAIDLHGCEFGPLEASGRCFADVFSCKPFDGERAATVAVEHFGGAPTLRILQR
jgi:hypothetical protein